MAYDIFRSQMVGSALDSNDVFRGVSGWEPENSAGNALGAQAFKNAGFVADMAGTGLQGLGAIAQAKDKAAKYQELEQQMKQQNKNKGLFGGILDAVGFGASLIPGVGPIAGMVTGAAKSFL